MFSKAAVPSPQLVDDDYLTPIKSLEVVDLGLALFTSVTKPNGILLFLLHSHLLDGQS